MKEREARMLEPRTPSSGRGHGHGAPPLVAIALPVYLGLGAVAALVTMALGRNPLATESWIGTEGAAAATLSVGLGAMVATATIAATRVLLRRAEWARALATELRPAVRHTGDRTILLLALASGVGEELLFRGLLVPTAGIAVSTLLFGLLHQARGRGRWPWMAWATVMGLLMAVVFVLTGSLLGAIVAHVAVNAMNLRLLRDSDFESKPPRPMGGLLRRA